MDGARATWEGVVLELRVRPKAGAFSVRSDEKGIVVALKNAAESGKANRELLRELGKLFGCEAELVDGAKQRKKAVLLKGALLSEVEKRLHEV